MIEPKKGKKEKQLLDILREVYDDEKILEVIIKAQVYAQVYNDELINGNISKEQIKKINNLIKK